MGAFDFEIIQGKANDQARVMRFRADMDTAGLTLAGLADVACDALAGTRYGNSFTAEALEAFCCDCEVSMVCWSFEEYSLSLQFDYSEETFAVMAWPVTK